MKISTFRTFIGDSFRNLRRNKTISFASMATVAATLFILGVFLLAILNVKQAIKEVESQVEIKVVLEDDITVSEKRDLEKKIKDTEGVEELSFESKYQALENLKSILGEENKELAEGLDKENPMPSSYVIKVKSPEDVSFVVKTIEGSPGIYTIKDGKELVGKIITITNALQWAGIIIFGILISVSLFLIGNTIKLTVYSRRREIGIMKYIGATDWFIRWPFILEGIIIGLIGAVLSTIVLYYVYQIAFVKLSSNLIMMQFIKPSYVLSTISWQFLIAGALIGSIGSIISIRKFLAV